MDEYVKKYLNILQKSEKLCSKDSICKRTISSFTPEPASILEKLTPRNKKLLTTTEEIYDEENFRFYNKIRSCNSSSPSSNKSPYPTLSSPAQTPSPFKTKISHDTTPSIQYNSKEFYLPNLKRIQKKSKIYKKEAEKIEKNLKKHYKINSILSACENAGEDFAINSKRLKHSIARERLIAQQYTKEID